MFVVSLVGGLIALVFGANTIVTRGGRLAMAFRVPALVVGLTIVAFGTSAPELTVSITAAFRASTEMALSNVNGSNIANIALVLGVASMIRPLTVQRSLLRRDISSLIVMQCAVLILFIDGVIDQTDGAILLMAGVAYNVWLFHDVLKGRSRLDEVDNIGESRQIWADVFFLLGGLAILLIGAHFMVDGAVGLAHYFNMSERYIGLTVVALGTSAPELVTAIVCARRGEVEMAVGNSIGSNILNITMVLGITAMLCPIEVSHAGVTADILVALCMALCLVPFAMFGGLGRRSGIVLVGSYICYLSLMTG